MSTSKVEINSGEAQPSQQEQVDALKKDDAKVHVDLRSRLVDASLLRTSPFIAFPKALSRMSWLHKLRNEGKEKIENREDLKCY